MAVDPQPVDGAVIAAAIPLIGFCEAAGELGELDFEEIDDLPQPDQLGAQLRTGELDQRSRAIALGRRQQLGRSFPLPNGHAPILQTNVRSVKPLNRVIWMPRTRPNAFRPTQGSNPQMGGWYWGRASLEGRAKSSSGADVHARRRHDA